MRRIVNPLRANIRAIPAGLAAIVIAAALAGAAYAQTSDLFNGFQKNSKDPVQIDAASLEIAEEGKQRISVFSGNVIVRRGDTVLRAKTIKVFSDLGDNRPKNQAFSRIEAAGGVEVTSGEQKVTGAKVVVDMGKQTITMTGNVVMSQGDNVITGERLIIDLVSGRARVEQEAGKPIRGVFTPGSGTLGPPGQ
jgi:lipopolysaccharide export system protein LptA